MELAKSPPPVRRLAPRALRVIVAAADPAGETCQSALARAGHAVEVVATASALALVCRAARPDLAVVDAGLPDGGFAAAIAACREPPVPVLVLADEPPADVDVPLYGFVGRAGVEAGLAPAAAVAVRLFEQAEACRREVADLRRQLEDRKLFERAKGVVARRLGLPEHEAYRRLVKRATEKNLRLADLARSVLAAEAVFEAFDGDGGVGGRIGR